MIKNVNTKRAAWVAPVVRELDVRETATQLNTGGDGGQFAGCTLS